MTRTSVIPADFAKLPAAKVGPASPRNGAINEAIILKINEIYPRDTVKTLACWLKLTWKTAKNRLDGAREFSLDEVSTLLHSEHGFEILSALMERAPKKPDWWKVCEPLMQLADAERMVEVARRRTQKVIRKREETIDALETEIRRAQTMAIHHPEQAGVRLEALRSYAGKETRVVAAGQSVKRKG